MRFFAALTALLASALVFAHGPSRLKANETITLKASPDVVWAKVKDFNQVQAWHPAIESSTATAGSDVGSVRTLKVKGGGEVIEKLEKLSDEERSMIYTAQDGGALPVTKYKAWLTVKPAADGGSEVEWRSVFFRVDQGDYPAAGKDDETATSTIKKVYTDGLTNLKALLDK
ncbi:MAG: SRPBCC family protein [Methyloversatilis sp.]|uniref:SRPBCC family protein n=1 Tax=Methyloversatilis sp. TaxID=2569862 RepID=UPI002737320E|nr:SRPBCC family protein [Methyloversatilis sp.]MDP3873230.1 SRPBCC family protein [Methyloversatilis sp.]